jgi:hypothetical protein
MIWDTEYMMTVDVKSRAESTRDAKTERDEEVKATMNFAMRRKTFAAKLMKIATFTMREFDLACVSSGEGSRADSSSKETLLEDGVENSDGRW